MRFFDRALGDGRSIRVCTTDRSDGDFAVGGVASDLVSRRRSIVDRPWIWLQQVHGERCIDVDAYEGEEPSGASADALITRSSTVALCVQTADCVPIVMWSEDGVIAAVHAGWRGLESGVIDQALTMVGEKTSAPISALIGPSIGPECYEFGEIDLNRLRLRFGDQVCAHTEQGRPALDVRSAVRSELQRFGVDIVCDDDRCTSCDERLFSHRARSDSARQTTAIWIEEQ